MMAPPFAANDNSSKDRFAALGDRAEALHAAFFAPDTTEASRADILAELREIVAERGAILADCDAQEAALKRQILALGGRTIRHVATDANGDTVIF